MHRGAFLFLLILGCLIKATRADISKQDLQKWIDDSALVFTGKMIKLGSNVDSIDMKDAPMIVKVESVESSNQEALAKFGSLVGKELTVVANPSSRIRAPKQGISVVFFVNPLLYERNIAVTANAIADEKTGSDFSKQLSEAIQRKNEKPLKEAVASAERIVTGTVKEVRALPETKLAQLRSFSEHSPKWREAVIDVQSDLKGEPSENLVIVTFPSTDDRAWAESPKFTAGETGIWLLHGQQVAKETVGILLAPEKFHGREIKVYTTLHPEDFQPRDPEGKNEMRIREILKELQR
jgi:hypothetical protein